MSLKTQKNASLTGVHYPPSGNKWFWVFLQQATLAVDLAVIHRAEDSRCHHKGSSVETSCSARRNTLQAGVVGAKVAIRTSPEFASVIVSFDTHCMHGAPSLTGSTMRTSVSTCFSITRADPVLHDCTFAMFWDPYVLEWNAGCPTAF